MKLKHLVDMLLITLLISCIEKPEKVKNFDFIITEKIQLPNHTGGFEYFLKSRDTIVECGTSDYALYNKGDTLKLVIPLDGLWEGKVMNGSGL